MGNRRRGHRSELQPSVASAAVDELHSAQPSSRSSSRVESARVSHLGVRSIPHSKFKPLQACTHRRGRDHARWGRRKEERDMLRRRWVCAKENPCFSFTGTYWGCLRWMCYILEEGAVGAEEIDLPFGRLWEGSLFTLLHQEHIEFRHYGLNNNVTQFCLLQIRSNQSGSGPSTPYFKESTSCGNLLVGNIHVLFNPKRGDIKLGQMRLFLKKARDLAEEWGRIPIILAGDFNSLPQRALYQLMSSPKLDVLRHDRGRISGQFDMPLTTFPTQQQGFFSSKAHAYKWSDEELRLAMGNEQETILHKNLQLCNALYRNFWRPENKR
ncbi:Carbon catabolite repressor protein 4 homolog 5-like protein [Drosera capensis]